MASEPMNGGTVGGKVANLIEAAYLEGWQACRNACDAVGGRFPLTAHTWDDESYDCSRSKLAADALSAVIDRFGVQLPPVSHPTPEAPDGE